MSVAELKQAVDKLSAEERLELAAYLRFLARQNDSEWRKEMGRRLNRCLQGEGHDPGDLQEIHKRLSAEGK